MSFATDITAIYGGRGSGKSTLSRKLIKEAKLPRVVFIDPSAREGFRSAIDVLEAVQAGKKDVVLASANRDECLRTIISLACFSTLQNPVFMVCDEAPIYMNKATPELLKLVYQGRHRGIGMMLITQRPTAIAAAIRSQASRTYWGRLTDHVDTQIANQSIGARSRGLSTARTGQFIRHPE